MIKQQKRNIKNSKSSQYFASVIVFDNHSDNYDKNAFKKRYERIMKLKIVNNEEMFVSSIHEFQEEKLLNTGKSNQIL